MYFTSYFNFISQKYGINNDVPDNAASDEEEYFLVDSPISPKVRTCSYIQFKFCEE